MKNFKDKSIRDQLKLIIGENCEPTQDLERMLLDAYALGRTDALDSLGLCEEDVPAGEGLMAWTA